MGYNFYSKNEFGALISWISCMYVFCNDNQQELGTIYFLVVLYLQKSIFTHIQLYVALHRKFVKSSSKNATTYN
jgi:hypothetical protein